MSSSEVRAVADSLPSALLGDLRSAFTREVQERLPGLVEVSDVEQARRDAHTLASSAWVVGEPDIARVARALEAELPGGPREELVRLLEQHLRDAS